MNFNVAFGQYVGGDSIVHRLDPRFKIICAILYIVSIFIARNIWTFVLLTAFTVALVFLSRISLSVVLKSIKSLMVILLITAVINVLWLKGDTLLVKFWSIEIYMEGIINAAIIALRIVLLLIGTSIFLTFTTTPIELSDGLDQLLSPLAKLKIPVHDFSMMMTIALRFIPTLIEETRKIMNAQKSRGADFDSGGIKIGRAHV